jgi:integrase
MPKLATGSLEHTSEGYVARITLKGRERESYLLSACKTPAQATERKELLASVAARFRRAGVIDGKPARDLLKTIATAAPALLPTALEVAGQLAGGLAIPGAKSKTPTFKTIGKSWTSGELHTTYPDHVADKDSDLDEVRLDELYAIDVGGVLLGDIAIDEFTLDHALTAMRNLPPRAKRPATRRQYAQLLSRVCALAVYPCRYIAASPLPRGFMPKVGKAPAFSYLYPNEDTMLLAHQTIPLGRRVLWGFLDREGPRSGEAVALRIGIDADLERGVVKLDENKTGDARAWAMDPHVAAALRQYVKLRGAKRGDALFVDEHGRPFDNDKLAGQLRADLEAAGVDRPELLNDGTNTRKFRVHDLRGTFVTLSLANGKTETWVADRTGHTTSEMINRYRRAARSATELGLGALQPLDQAIPELRLPSDCPEASDTGPAPAWQVQKIKHKAEVAELADAADSKSAIP